MALEQGTEGLREGDAAEQRHECGIGPDQPLGSESLVRDTYAADDLFAGRLAIVLEAPEATAFAYWFVTRPGDDQRPEVAAFKTWIMGEAASS